MQLCRKVFKEKLIYKVDEQVNRALSRNTLAQLGGEENRICFKFYIGTRIHEMQKSKCADEVLMFILIS